MAVAVSSYPVGELRIDAQDGVLACPKCGYDYTHIDRVTVHSRREDASEADTNVTVAEVYDEVPESDTLPRKVPDNPSARRSGIVIDGQCEDGCRFQLTIAQHKGQTLIGTRLPL